MARDGLTRKLYMKLLIVDDDPLLAEILQACLQDFCSWQAGLATTGEAAIERVAIERPDVILLDAGLSDMTGIAFCARLRADPNLRDIPVIFLTGNLQPDELGRYRAAGAIGALAKPFEPTTLCAQIAALLG